MNSTHNVPWNLKLWDMLHLLYWTPRFVGFSSISEDKYPADFKVPRALKGTGYRLYRRNRKIDDLLAYLNGQEEFLNIFLNIAFAIAPDEVVSRLLCMPLEIPDAGPFKSLGPSELARQYGWGDGENVTTPDGFYITDKSLVATELKLGSKSSPGQIAKYLALMRWEQKSTGQRDHLGLLFILPEKSLASHWAGVGLNAPSGGGGATQPTTIRRCPPKFFDTLNHEKLPLRVCQLFNSEEGQIRSDIERLRLTAVSWTWLRDEISRIESELDCSIRGDQTLKRLLVGLRVQIGDR